MADEPIAQIEEDARLAARREKKRARWHVWYANLSPERKEQMAERSRRNAAAWKKANPERARIASREWERRDYAANPAKYAAKKKRLRNTDAGRKAAREQAKRWEATLSPERKAARLAKKRVQNAAWAARNPEKQKIAIARWMRNNAERMRNLVMAWRKNNPEKDAATQARSRTKNAYNARYRAFRGKDEYTPDDISAIFKAQRGHCAICGKKLDDAFQRDHIKPLFLKGMNVRQNIQLVHAIRNQRKGRKDPIDFMRSQGFLL